MAKAKASKGAKGDRFPRGTLALASNNSSNKKIGNAATTYAAQTSCPTSCPFFDGGGCYAENGALGKFVTAPLNRAARAVPRGGGGPGWDVPAGVARRRPRVLGRRVHPRLVRDGRRCRARALAR